MLIFMLKILKEKKNFFYDTNVNFGVDRSGMPIGNADYPSYGEFIFDIDKDKLDEYQLLGCFSTCKQIEGPWQVSFKAEDGKTLKKSLQYILRRCKNRRDYH